MYENFKKELEIAYRIHEWEPNDDQLLEIAKYIKNNPEKIDQVSAYICDICKNVLLGLFEGVDNSDLDYLIALATKTLKEAK